LVLMVSMGDFFVILEEATPVPLPISWRDQ